MITRKDFVYRLYYAQRMANKTHDQEVICKLMDALAELGKDADDVLSLVYPKLPQVIA